MSVQALHAQLEIELAGLAPRTVAGVLRVFLDVSMRPCAEPLWSFEFAFDEDDGRIARLEARFRRAGSEVLPGYQVDMTLPKELPQADRGDWASAARSFAGDSLLARFQRAIAELGAYRTIENVELVAVDTYLV